MNKTKKGTIRILLTAAISAVVILGGASIIYATTNKSMEVSPVAMDKYPTNLDKSDPSIASGLNVDQNDPNIASGLNVDQSMYILTLKSQDGKLTYLVPPNTYETSWSAKLGEIDADGMVTVFVTVNGQDPDGAPEEAFVEGTPGKDDLTSEVAVKKAESAIQSKYALTNESLSRFDNQAAFEITNPDEPKWCITFYPKNEADFVNIGSYYVVLDAKTGEIINVTSAADGVG